MQAQYTKEPNSSTITAAALQTEASSVSQKISPPEQSSTYPKATPLSDTPATPVHSSAATQQINHALAPWLVQEVRTLLQLSKLLNLNPRALLADTATTTEILIPPATTHDHTTPLLPTAIAAATNPQRVPVPQAARAQPTPRGISHSPPDPQQHITAPPSLNRTYQHVKSSSRKASLMSMLIRLLRPTTRLARWGAVGVEADDRIIRIARTRTRIPRLGRRLGRKLGLKLRNILLNRSTVSLLFLLIVLVRLRGLLRGLLRAVVVVRRGVVVGVRLYDLVLPS